MQEPQQPVDKLAALVEQPSDKFAAVPEQPSVTPAPLPEGFVPVVGEVRVGAHLPSEQVFLAIDEAGVRVSFEPEHMVLIAQKMHKSSALIQRHRKTKRRR